MRLVLMHVFHFIVHSEDVRQSSPCFAYVHVDLLALCSAYAVNEICQDDLLDLFGTEILSNLKCKATVWSIKGDHITRGAKAYGSSGSKTLS